MVSAGLQKHFDSKQKKKQLATKFQDLQGKIDPAFLLSFEKFRLQVLEIVDDSPESCDIAEKQIDTLGTKLEQVNNKKRIKTFEAVTDNV